MQCERLPISLLHLLSLRLRYLRGRMSAVGRAVAPPLLPPRSKIQVDTGCSSVSLGLAGTRQWDKAGPGVSPQDSSDPARNGKKVRMRYCTGNEYKTAHQQYLRLFKLPILKFFSTWTCRLTQAQAMTTSAFIDTLAFSVLLRWNKSLLIIIVMPL